MRIAVNPPTPYGQKSVVEFIIKFEKCRNRKIFALLVIPGVQVACSVMLIFLLSFRGDGMDAVAVAVKSYASLVPSKPCGLTPFKNELSRMTTFYSEIPSREIGVEGEVDIYQ